MITSKNMLYNLYIGANNTTGKVEKEKAIKLISKTFEGLTLTNASGYWQGKPEKSIVISIETEKKELVLKVAKELTIELKQDAVGVAKIGKMDFIA